MAEVVDGVGGLRVDLQGLFVLRGGLGVPLVLGVFPTSAVRIGRDPAVGHAEPDDGVHVLGLELEHPGKGVVGDPVAPEAQGDGRPVHVRLHEVGVALEGRLEPIHGLHQPLTTQQDEARDVAKLGRGDVEAGGVFGILAVLAFHRGFFEDLERLLEHQAGQRELGAIAPPLGLLEIHQRQQAVGLEVQGGRPHGLAGRGLGQHHP